jgi:hypothetical protein
LVGGETGGDPIVVRTHFVGRPPTEGIIWVAK